jgi:hypothetical protein
LSRQKRRVVYRLLCKRFGVLRQRSLLPSTEAPMNCISRRRVEVLIFRERRSFRERKIYSWLGFRLLRMARTQHS